MIKSFIVDLDDQEAIDAYMNAPIKDGWDKKHMYQLYGVVTHAGSMSGGHYVAYV
jgi:ubiquitin C-terminal hydrolase